MCKSVAQKGLRSRLGIDKNAGVAAMPVFQDVSGLNRKEIGSKNPEGPTYFRLRGPQFDWEQKISGQLILSRPDIFVQTGKPLNRICGPDQDFPSE